MTRRMTVLLTLGAVAAAAALAVAVLWGLGYRPLLVPSPERLNALLADAGGPAGAAEGWSALHPTRAVLFVGPDMLFAELALDAPAEAVVRDLERPLGAPWLREPRRATWFAACHELSVNAESDRDSLVQWRRWRVGGCP